MGDYRAAIELLENVTVDSSDPRLLTTLAYSYEQVLDYGAAAEAYSRALELEPNNVAYRKAWDRVIFGASNTIKHWISSRLSFAPTRRTGKLICASVRSIASSTDMHWRDKNLDKALELFPDNLDVQYNRALLAEAEGKLQRPLI